MPSAITVTSPPRPAECVSPRTPVRVFGGGRPPEPSIDSMPDTSTNTLPLFPAAPALVNVVLATKPLLVRLNFPAVTFTLPALPVPNVTEPIPSNIEELAPTDMSTAAEPATLTETSPAFPFPLANVPRDDPESTVREPTETATPPPAPAGASAPEAR